MNPLQLNELFEVYGRFHRSIQVQKDWQDDNSLTGYLPTPTVHEIIRLILSNLATVGKDRAFAISGPFGTGKSAFLLFLTDLLAKRPPRHPDAITYFDNGKVQVPYLYPILIVGERVSLHEKLREALIHRIGLIAPEEIGFLQAITNITALYQAGVVLARQRGWDGLLVVLDEFGKFLEYAALKPDQQDVFAMQQLAEEAVRSPEPFLLITVQHSSMADYLNIASDVQRTEWQKVQGRFKDITFLEPPSQLLSLMQRSIVSHLDESASKQYARVIQNIIGQDVFAEASRRFNLHNLAPHLAPLHPLTALLLVVAFRSQLAQNERSLFAFLSSQEFFSFREFLDTEPYTEPPPLYTPDRLYDYLVTSLGGALYLGERSYLWRDIESHLQRLSSTAAPLAERVIKLVGLLTLYGSSIGVKPDLETLQLALSDASPEAVAETIESLEQTQVLLYRRLMQAYVLWEGVHVDLDVSAQEAERHLTSDSIARRLVKFLPTSPLVARAHYIRSGTLRFYAVEYRDGQQQATPPDFGAADGVVSYILTTSQQERNALLEDYQAATRHYDGLWLVAFPPPLQRLDAPLKEAEIWEWVQSNDRQLEGDEGARREVAVRLLLAEERLRFLLQDSLNMAAILWQHKGDTHQFEHSRNFQTWLSQLCDTTFSQAPTLHNELLNRRKLSAAAVAARRTLLEGMLTHEHDPQLGFTRTPPEVSMYRSLLEAGGFHQRVGNEYTLRAPGDSWQAVWTEMEQFLASTHSQRRPIIELYQRLQSPPYGLREGPLPVLLLALLLVHRRQVALYEEGLFVSDLRIEVIERLTRNPELYEIQEYEISRAQTDFYQQVWSELEPLDLALASGSDESPLLGIVRALVTTVAKLPPYTRSTRRFDDPHYATVRDTILRAKDPYQLMHGDLPNALDMTSEDSAFAKTLHDSLDALIQSYPRLLDLIESHLRDTFRLHGSATEAFDHLRTRSLPLVRYATDINLSLFLREATTTTPRGDRREALGRAIARGKSPMQWNDNDVSAFKSYLLALVSEYERLEALVLEREKEGVQSVLRVDVLNGSLEEARRVISIPPEQEQEVTVLLSQLRATLETVQHDNVQLAAVARLAHELLTRPNSNDRPEGV